MIQPQETTIVKRIPNEVMMEDIRRLLRENPYRTITIVVVGYSMRPFLEHLRDRVELAAVHHVKVGDAVLAEVSPAHYVFHRVINRQGDRLTLMGDGNICGTEECRVTDVIATANAFIRGDRRYLPSGIAWRVYSKLWVPMRPLRRWLLLPYRAYRHIINKIKQYHED